MASSCHGKNVGDRLKSRRTPTLQRSTGPQTFNLAARASCENSAFIHVIGETTEIGDDCYVLGGVTLGASGIAGHPVIGNRVQIGAFARVFGLVRIGDDAFIGPHCVVKDDVPPQTTITVRTEHQMSRRQQLHSEALRSPLISSGPALAERNFDHDPTLR